MSRRYQDEALQDRLAAEYALGHLRGGARRRLATLMRRHARLRDQVALWEERLFPVILRAPPMVPPPRVWRAIRRRIAPAARHRPERRRWWARLAAAGLAGAALGVGVYLAVTPREPAPTLFALLSDAQARPGVLVSWTPQQATRRQLSVRILAHPSMPPGTSWQAWLVPAAGAAPISLGFVGTDLEQVLAVSPAAARALPGAVAIGLSVEGKQGSQTGRPTLPYLFEGPVLRIDS